MSYQVRFAASALKSWNKLDSTIRVQFEKVIRRRVENPHVLGARLRAKGSVYKIKLRDSGYRLVYDVHDEVLVIRIIGVGRRDDGYDDLLVAGRESLDDLD